jgi:DmsE family decaheme c-type cytochrome
MFKLARLPSIPTLLLAFPLLVLSIAAGDHAARAQTATEAAATQDSGSDAGKRCLRCHDDRQAMTMLHTKHGQMADPGTPLADKQCETCHGRSDDHVSATPKEGDMRPLADVVFGPESATPASAQNAVCMNCHQGGIRMNWTVSPHATSDVACATCHNLHALRDNVLTKATQPKVCFTCHAEQRAQTHKRSHHPINEGLVVCSDCHNPHGAFGDKLLKQATVNDTCYQCHAEKRGPFLWEHAPVTDSCMNCHTPHGSAQPRLLVVRAAWLCQQCHTEQFHPSTLYSGEFFDATSSSVSRLTGKSCLNCHSQIHGSNHPSGVRLTR